MVLCRLCVYSTKDTGVYDSARCSDTSIIASFLQHNSRTYSSKPEVEAFIVLGDGYLKGIWRYSVYMFWANFK